jgi:hypothetical protein
VDGGGGNDKLSFEVDLNGARVVVNVVLAFSPAHQPYGESLELAA